MPSSYIYNIKSSLHLPQMDTKIPKYYNISIYILF